MRRTRAWLVPLVLGSCLVLALCLVTLCLVLLALTFLAPGRVEDVVHLRLALRDDTVTIRAALLALVVLAAVAAAGARRASRRLKPTPVWPALPRARAAGAHRSGVRLPGTDASRQPTVPGLRVQVTTARPLVAAAVRSAAGVKPEAPPRVVWRRGMSELLVHLDRVDLRCAPGLVTISVTVAYDQFPAGAVVDVPFAVGTAQAASGLVMATFARPTGPAEIIDGWAEPLTAFAWETLLRLAELVCLAAGTGSAGAPLVAGAIGADHDALLVQPTQRHAPATIAGVVLAARTAPAAGSPA